MTDNNKLRDTIMDMEASLSTNLSGYSMWHYGADIHGITRETLKNAIEALKAQEPRVMKVGDVRNWVNSDRVTREPVVIEIRGGVCAWIIDDEIREIPGAEDLTSDLYCRTWRCWTSRPTDKQREAVKWE